MERKEKLKLVGVIIGAIIFLGIIAYFPCKVLRTETDPNLQLLAIGIILTIVLGGVNMLKSLFKSAEVKTLEKAIESFKNKMKKERVIEMINKFIQPFIWDFEEKMGKIDKSLSGQEYDPNDFLIRIDDEYAHMDILGENYEWIKGRVDECNKLIRDERLEEAKEKGADFKNKLEELKERYLADYDIPKDKIKKKQKLESKRGLI